jgi:hypothetical protein
MEKLKFIHPEVEVVKMNGTAVSQVSGVDDGKIHLPVLPVD